MSDSDFDRNLCLILGLTFDIVDMEGAVRKIVHAVENGHKTFLSTPNLNFLIASQKNAAFRESVLNSDFSIADGMPIILISKLLGLPVKERVTGSGLIEALQLDEACRKNPIKVLFFGGEDGMAETAHHTLNTRKSGLKSVGFLNPGFGSIEDMSKRDIIDEINAKKPDFIIVSLGAAKGQAWISHNISALDAPVISHLGAVVNFMAGSVARAPEWMQRCHLEWFWRIKEEPVLFKRYWHDGIAFLNLLMGVVLPHRRWLKAHKPPTKGAGGGCITHEDSENLNVVLQGQLSEDNLAGIRSLFKEISNKKCHVVLDMAGVTFMDSAFLSHLLMLRKQILVHNCQISVTGLNDQMKKILLWNQLGFLIEGP